MCVILFIFFCLFMYMYVYLYLSVPLSVNVSIYQSIYLSTYLSINVSIHPLLSHIHQSLYQFYLSHSISSITPFHPHLSSIPSFIHSLATLFTSTLPLINTTNTPFYAIHSININQKRPTPFK